MRLRISAVVAILSVFYTVHGVAAEEPAPAQPETRAPRYGLSVYRSSVSLVPYGYDNFRHQWPGPQGPVHQNSDTAYPFTFWYYHEASRLYFELGASRYILPQARFQSTVLYATSAGTPRMLVGESQLPFISRSVQTALILRPFQLGSTRLLFGGGLRHMLREEAAFTGSTMDYATTRLLGAQLALRWEVPVGASFVMEPEALGYGGPARCERPPYLFVTADQSYWTTLVSSRSIGAHIWGGELGLRLRYRIDENLSLTVGYQQGIETRRLDRVFDFFASAGPATAPALTPSLTDAGEWRNERFAGYSVGVTMLR